MRRPVVVSALSATAVLGLGGALTTIGPWYFSLRKPSWQPPGWAFGPAWTVIGGTTAWAAVAGWDALTTRRQRTTLICLFAANGALNVAWTVLFFNRQRPDLALREVVLLWLSIAALLVDLATVSRRAAWLMTPYLAWVSFAAYLNLTIVRLNPSVRPS